MTTKTTMLVMILELFIIMGVLILSLFVKTKTRTVARAYAHLYVLVQVLILPVSTILASLANFPLLDLDTLVALIAVLLLSMTVAESPAMVTFMTGMMEMGAYTLPRLCWGFLPHVSKEALFNCKFKIQHALKI